MITDSEFNQVQHWYMKKMLATLWLVLLISCTSHIFSRVIAATIADDLTKLNNLYKEGAITKEEFSKAKSILFKSDSIESKSENKKKRKEKNQKIKKEKDRKEKGRRNYKI